MVKPVSFEVRMTLLFVLYSLQGVWFGFFFETFMIRLREVFSFSGMGLIAWAGTPFAFKMIQTPFVESMYFEWPGKRLSWIVPNNFICAFALYMLGTNLEAYLEAKDSFTIFIWAVLYTICVCNSDIALDGLAVEIIPKEKQSFAASSESVGINIGRIFGASGMTALSSLSFCNTYLFSEPRDKPLISLD